LAEFVVTHYGIQNVQPSWHRTQD